MKTAQCDELRKENFEPQNNKDNNVSHPSSPGTLVVCSLIIRHLNERDMKDTAVKSISGALIKYIIRKCDKSADIYREVVCMKTHFSELFQ